MKIVFRFLRRNRSVLLGLSGLIPFLFLLFLITLILAAPDGWNEMGVPSALYFLT